MSVFIIAEAGVNHNGSLEIAKRLVDEAKSAGADCIKFQTFVAENLVSKDAKRAKYQIDNQGGDDTQYQMLKKLELSYDEFREIKAYCDEKEIVFLSTSFDFESIEFLKKLNMPIWKVPSGEVTNLPYLEKIARIGVPVILSTGMCTIHEIGDAICILKSNRNDSVTVLHCTTEYPTPYSEVNLNAMLTIKEHFNVLVGYSDHTRGIEIPIAAVALGASVIEKHFTLDRMMEGPDHKASLEPKELKSMVSAIRHIEMAMGDGVKTPYLSELQNKKNVRKSIVAKVDIKSGEVFSEENITVKRPGDGISPMKWYEVLGKVAERNFKKDEQIQIG